MWPGLFSASKGISQSQGELFWAVRLMCSILWVSSKPLLQPAPTQFWVMGDASLCCITLAVCLCESWNPYNSVGVKLQGSSVRSACDIKLQLQVIALPRGCIPGPYSATGNSCVSESPLSFPLVLNLWITILINIMSWFWRKGSLLMFFAIPQYAFSERRSSKWQ